MSNSFKQHLHNKFLITDFAIYIATSFVFGAISRLAFVVNPPYSETTAIALYIPLLLLTIFGLAIPLYLERKTLNLKIKNIWLLIPLVTFTINLVAVCTLPSTLTFPAVSEASITITPFIRMYSIVYGLIIGLIPFLFFYVLPKTKFVKNHIDYIFYFILIVASVFVIGSFFVNFHDYVAILKNGLSAINEHCVGSFIHKNEYCTILLFAIFACIYLDVTHKNWHWLLLFIPILLLEIFTFAKMPIVLSLLTVIVYLLYKLINVLRKSRDNLIIGALCLAFVLIGLSVLTVFIVNSQSGILFKIKSFINTALESANSTFSSRILIWQTTLNALTPLRYIFGYGFVTSSFVIHLVYNFDPRCPEPNTYISHAHNGGVEALVEGGIIFLIINIAILIYLIYMCVKQYKKHRAFSIVTLIFIAIMLIDSSVEPILVMHESTSFLLDVIIIIPISVCHFREKEQILQKKYAKQKI